MSEALNLALLRFLEAHPAPVDGKSLQVREILECAHGSLFSCQLNVAWLRARCRVADNNISSRFKHELGLSIKQYLEASRLEAARYVLADEARSYPVGQVALAVGYRHLQTFHAAFLRRYGTPPASLCGRGTRVGRRAERPVQGTNPSLTAPRRLTMVAAMECVLPTGFGPGATAANAIGYVEWLANQAPSSWRSDSLADGLDLLDRVACTMYGHCLWDCSAPEQIMVMETVQGIPHRSVQRFFGVLVRLTLSGFLCAPAYGGNRDFLGWHYVGFSPRMPRTASDDQTCAAEKDGASE